ncbi:MAG: hypothetical protein ACLTWR_07650 [Agathobaculum desmolans]|uniref:hypothetical protein n=1 Tax=Agathobaculum desmolans TaxID=39484 RepID=UPI00399211E7
MQAYQFLIGAMFIAAAILIAGVLIADAIAGGRFLLCSLPCTNQTPKLEVYRA